MDEYQLEVVMMSRLVPTFKDVRIITFACGSPEWAVRYTLDDFKKLYGTDRWKIKVRILSYKPLPQFPHTASQRKRK